MNRRHFLKRVSAAPAIAAGAGRLLGAGEDPVSRIGVTTWSLHDFFPKTRSREAPAATPTITLSNFFKLAANKWGLKNFELVNNHFESTEPDYLAELKRVVQDVGGRLHNICVDIDGTNLSDDNEEKRKASVEAVKKWIDVAVAIGSPSIRCNTGESQRHGAIDKTIASYKALVAYSGPQKVRVIIENHGGVSYVPEKVVEIMTSVGGPWIGTLPDFGNWPDDPVRYRGLAAMFPYARICHTKLPRLKAATETPESAFGRCVEVAEKAGFKGIYSIEQGSPEDPMQVVPRMVALLKQELSKIAQA